MSAFAGTTAPLRRPRAAALAAALCAAILLPALAADTAGANKVGNPSPTSTGTQFTASLTGGLFRVKTNNFNLADIDPNPTLRGAVLANGAATFLQANIVFPPLNYDVNGDNITIKIVPTHDWTGNLNPLNGVMTLRARFRLKLEGSPSGVSLGGSCYIGSTGSPIDLNVATTGTTSPPGPNGPITGTPYNPSNGEVIIVNNSFSVPGADGCGTFGIANGPINDAIGLPSSAGNNEGRLNLDFNPVVRRAITASFTASPNTGSTPLTVNFNGSGSFTEPAGNISQYRWDFDGNNTVDQTTTTPTTSHVYASPGSFQPKLTVADTQGDVHTVTGPTITPFNPPDLIVDKSHTGDFVVGQPGSYTLEVHNNGPGPTTGTTTVTDTLPTGLSFASGTGSGWSCSATGQVVTCTRSAAIAANADAPDITLNVGVGAAAASSVTNNVSVSTANELTTNNNSDSDPTTVNRVDLALDKSHSGGFPVGGEGTYTLAVDNGGTAASFGTTTVTDTLPDELSYISATGTGWNCGADGQQVTCTRAASIGAGQSAPEIALQVAVNPTPAPQVTNTASVSAPGDVNGANDSDSDPTNLTAPDLAIAKSHAGQFRVFSTGSWTLAVSNAGERPTAGTTTVADTIPDGLVPISAAGTGWICTLDGQEVSCDLAQVLAPSQAAPLINIQVQVTEEALPSVINTATVSSSGTGADADPRPANDTSSDPTEVIAIDLAIDKSHLGGFPITQQGTYTLSVQNEGGAATIGATTVTDELPEGLTYVNASGSGWSCGAVGQAVTCTRASAIGGGQTAPPITLTVQVAQTDEEELVNSASVSTADDIDPSNDSDSDPTPLTAADLTIAKSHSGDFTAGTTRAYTLRVSNVGVAPTVGETTVTDELPSGLTYVNGTGSGWSCAAAGQQVTCTRPTPVATGATAPSITLQVAIGGSAAPGVTNVATVSNGSDRNDANDSASDPTAVLAPDLALTKSHDGALEANSRTSYLIEVENVGDADTAAAATVTDTLPDGLSYAGSPSGDWSCEADGLDPQQVSCEHPGSIPAGSGAENLELLVDVGPVAGDEATNTATVSVADDSDAANDTDADTSPLSRIDLAIDKSHQGDLPRGGDASYTIAVQNLGDTATTGQIRVSDELPDDLSFSGASGTGWSCSLVAGTVGCVHDGPLAGGASAQEIVLEVGVAADADAQVTNTAAVSTPRDGNASNDTDSDQGDVVAMPDAAVSIRPQVAPGGSFRVGTNGNYTVTVRNAGAAPTTGPTTATATLPAGLSYVGGTGSGWACSNAAQVVSCVHAASLAPGSRSDIGLEVGVAKAAASGVTTNAQVSTAGDPDSGNDSSSAPTTVTMIDLAIDAAPQGVFRPGESGSFLVAVTNVGSAATIAPATVVDVLPDGLSYSSASGPGWSCSGSGTQANCTQDAPIAAGVTAVFALSVSVEPDATPGSTNTATVATADDVEPTNDTSTSLVPMIRSGAASVQIRSGKVRVKKGRARVKLTCLPAAGRTCRGSLALTGRRGKPKLGSAGFQLEPGSSAAIAVRLSKAARRKLARRGKLLALASAVLADAARSGPASARVKLVQRRRR